MLGSLDILAETPLLRPLLDHYQRLRAGEAQPEWHDRARPGNVPPDQWRALHGLLIAHGWLDVQVGPETLAVPGELRSCYRITREGRAALRGTDEHFGVALLAADDD